jgi:arylsulfatase A-like enzyme
MKNITSGRFSIEKEAANLTAITIGGNANVLLTKSYLGNHVNSIKTTAIGLAILSMIPGTAVAGEQPSSHRKKKPNVIILFADQHHKAVMGFEGHPDVLTPNLDILAKQSVVFDRAYCTKGICAPSRSSLMTGLYSRTMGLLSNGEKTSVINDVVSLATLFQQNNYRTYAFGKRHTSGAVDAGWDVQRSHLCNETPGNSYTEWVEKNGYAKEFARDWSAEFGKGSPCSTLSDEKIPTADLGTRISALPENMTMEAFTTQLTVQMIRDQAKSDQPFFCWATFYRPHQPYTPLKKYMDLYDVSAWGEGRKNGSSIRKPASLYEPKENVPPMMQSIRDGGNKVWNVDKAFLDEQLWRNHVGAYYALVTEVDHCVGEILNALDEAGITEETIVIYTSDHGDFVGNHGMVEKAAAGQNVYEDILNIPLIIRYPGNRQQGKRSAELVSLVDIYPTLVDLLGLKMPALKYPLQGLSMAETLTKGRKMKREYFVSESWSQATVITKDYKLGIMLDPTDHARKFDFRSFGDQFFIRSTDPAEQINKIKDAHYDSETEKLRGFYADFTTQIPDIGKKEVSNSARNVKEKK